MVSNKFTFLTVISNLCLCLNLTFNLLKRETLKVTRYMYTTVKYQLNDFGQFEEQKENTMEEKI